MSVMLDTMSAPILLPTLAMGVVSFVVWYAVSWTLQRRRYPPGPMPYPLIGNLSQLPSNKHIWDFYTELHEKYGDIFTLIFGTRPTIVLGNMDLIREALLKKADDFAGRPDFYSFELFSHGYKDITAGRFGPVWQRQRKLSHAGIRKYASGETLAALIRHSTQKAFVEMDKVADTGRRFRPRYTLNMIVYNIICSMVFGKVYEYDDPFVIDFIKKTDVVNENFGLGLLADFLPIFKYLPSPDIDRIRILMDESFKLIRGTFEEHEKNFDESNPKDLVDHFLQSRNEAVKKEGKEATEGLTEDHYLMTIMETFSAGTDSSRMTLQWCVMYLAAYPEYQKKLQQEVDSVVDRDQPLQIEHRSMLPYNEAFLHEVMRIRPIAPIGVHHTTTCDTSVGGYDIPKDTQVMINVWAVHMDPKEWENPEEFWPERFLGEDGKMGPPISAWLPFSTGRRACVGQVLAKAELHLTLASLMQRYNFAAPPGVVMNMDCIEGMQFMSPKDFEVILTKRK